MIMGESREQKGHLKKSHNKRYNGKKSKMVKYNYTEDILVVHWEVNALAKCVCLPVVLDS